MIQNYFHGVIIGEKWERGRLMPWREEFHVARFMWMPKALARYTWLQGPLSVCRACLVACMRGGRKGKEGNGRVRRARWAIVEDQQVTATLPSRSGGRVSSESYTKKALHER